MPTKKTVQKSIISQRCATMTKSVKIISSNFNKLSNDDLEFSKQKRTPFKI